MRPAASIVTLACILLAVHRCSALDNGLGIRPAMGFNTWNAFNVHINEQKIRDMADALVDRGFVEAGYTYLNIDGGPSCVEHSLSCADAWSRPTRSDEGRLLAHPDRFPSGIKNLSDYVHSKGMKLGIYSDAGPLTCAGYPGSRHHEEDDARTWADWGIDYLKYDNCWAAKSDWVVDRYVAMRDALNKTGRPILFSLCEWGVADPWLWAQKVGNSWRTTGDISPNWDSFLRCLDNNVGLARYAGPGAWNDPDMLEVGNQPLSLPEQRAHFALWALMKSPLLIGTDLLKASQQAVDILMAEEVIAVNQDDLGVAGDLIWKEGPNEVYAGPLKGGSRAVVLFNRHSPDYRYNNMTVTWEQLGYSSGESAVVRDMFLQEDLGEYTGSFTAPVEAHNVLALRITPVEENAERNERWRPWRQQKDELLASTQPQTADWQADDRLSIRTRKPRLLTLQARSVLRRMGFLSQ